MSTPRDLLSSISVVIPVYNGAASLHETLTDVHSRLSAWRLPFEIIVVDDGSTDDSAAIAERFGAGLSGPTLRLIRSTPNRGKGHAVRTGMLAAEPTSRWVLFMDVDNSTNIVHLERFAPVAAELLGKAEAARGGEAGAVVIASRRLAESRIVRKQNPIRQALGRTFPYLVRLLAVSDLSDTQCGFKLFSRRAAAEVFSRLKTDGFAFDVEALLLAKKLGYPIAEVAADWNNPTVSTLKVHRHTAPMLWDVLKMRWRLRK